MDAENENPNVVTQSQKSEFSPELLSLYYSEILMRFYLYPFIERLFPYKQMFKWLCYGNGFFRFRI